ncbi:MAG: hypothetical protein HY275_04900, partial [Gemmatimonadetes bacterium]|nr:hypothetical protein [Gemmatimonadota bacterium]
MSAADRLAARRAELERRLAALTPEQRSQLDAAAPAAVAPVIPPRDPSAPVPLSMASG